MNQFYNKYCRLIWLPNVALLASLIYGYLGQNVISLFALSSSGQKAENWALFNWFSRLVEWDGGQKQSEILVDSRGTTISVSIMLQQQ